MFSGLLGSNQWVVVIISVVLNIAALVAINWIAKKISRAYFKKYWACLGFADCRRKSRRIWYVEGAFVLLMLALVVLTRKTEMINYLNFYTAFLPVWTLSAVHDVSRDYINDRFPDDCSKKGT